LTNAKLLMSEKAESTSYTFYYVDFCNMCGASADGHKIVGQRLNQSQGFHPKSKNGIAVSVMKCNVCNLIYANPQPIPNNSDDHEFIDVWAKEYFEYDENYFTDEITRAKNLLNFQDGMKALDIGAGIGKGLRSLKEAGFDAFGIEPSAAACKFAYEKIGIPPEKLHCKSIENADFAENTFDFVNFGAVLEHVYNPSESLKSALKWLKPNGIIFAEIPNSGYFITKLMNIYNKLNGTNFTSHISPMHPPFHHFEFGTKSFESFCEKNDCKIADSRILVCTTPFLPKVFVPIVDKYMSLTNTGMQISIFLQKNG
jgi:2-polyprenyl-3-methyl-5-hydroxy-6-metoxy-1,4-benzoquinol methylase